MPASVKMFFENEEGFQQRIKEAEKVFQFQTSQVSMFVKKNKEYRQQYYRLKKQHHSLVQTEQSLRAAIDKEKAWIEKCKIAYRLVFSFFLGIIKIFIPFKICRSNIISPHLFNDTTIDMSIDNTCTSGYGSQASPFFKKTPQKSQVETSTLSDHMSKMNMNRLDERQRSQIPSQSEAQNPYKSSFVETRRNLVDNTLQHMQNISQNKYPTIQRNKM